MQNNGKKTAEQLAAFRWKPGQSGNPSGRPGFKPVMDIVKRVLAEPSDHDANMSKAEELVRNLIDRAIAGDPTSIKELLSRWEPVPKNGITINNSLGEVRQSFLDLLDRMHVRCEEHEGRTPL